MTLHTWWLFFAAVFLLSATPGPNMLHILTRSVRFGARRSVISMTGCLTAVILIMTASAAGLSAVLAASPRLFQALRYAGVAYLVFLGIKAWRGRGSPIDVGAASLAAAPLSNGSLFRGGFIIGLCNPKLLMFAAAFLPQFIDRAAPQAPQFAIIVVTFAIAESFWYAVYGLGGRTLATYLTRPVLIRIFNRITGGIFVSFGVALLQLEP